MGNEVSLGSHVNSPEPEGRQGRRMAHGLSSSQRLKGKGVR